MYHLSSEQIEEQVVNVILELSSPDSLDEYRTEAVAVSITCLHPRQQSSLSAHVTVGPGPLAIETIRKQI